MPLNIDKMVALFEKIPIVLSDTGDSKFYTCDSLRPMASPYPRSSEKYRGIIARPTQPYLMHKIIIGTIKLYLQTLKH